MREALGLHARLGDRSNDRVDALQPLAVVGLACRAEAVRRLPEEAAERGRGGAERAEHFGVVEGGWWCPRYRDGQDVVRQELMSLKVRRGRMKEMDLRGGIVAW